MPRDPEDDLNAPELNSEDEEAAASQNEDDFFDSPSEGNNEREPSEPYAPRPPASGTSGYKSGGVDKKVVNLTSDIPVQVVAVLGKKIVTVKDILSLRMGQVVELNRLPNEAIDLVANGKLIAKGELVDIDGRLGLRILKIF